jgi:hypothetical protein
MQVSPLQTLPKRGLNAPDLMNYTDKNSIK